MTHRELAFPSHYPTGGKSCAIFCSSVFSVLICSGPPFSFTTDTSAYTIMRIASRAGFPDRVTFIDIGTHDDVYR